MRGVDCSAVRRWVENAVRRTDGLAGGDLKGGKGPD
mgnify:CR=1 FL=1